jgi:NAD dependent epimerase/dehydratase family enzyme
MSTAHIYGDPETGVTESSPTGIGFAPEIGRAWEEAFERAALPSQKRVILRTGFVLGCEGGAGHGALARLEKLARLGVGGTVGSGRQGMSWIHEHDLNRLIERGLRHPGMNGTYIASAPNPVSNREFMKELRGVAGGLGALGVGLPAAEWMVRLGARWLLNTDPELALYGRYVISKRLKDEGFVFSYPSVRDALRALYGRGGVA